MWQQAHADITSLTGEIAKSCVQNPSDLRAVALAAVQMAARPHDLGLDADQAADFCLKLMS